MIGLFDQCRFISVTLHLKHAVLVHVVAQMYKEYYEQLTISQRQATLNAGNYTDHAGKRIEHAERDQLVYGGAQNDLYWQAWLARCHRAGVLHESVMFDPLYMAQAHLSAAKQGINRHSHELGRGKIQPAAAVQAVLLACPEFVQPLPVQFDNKARWPNVGLLLEQIERSSIAPPLAHDFINGRWMAKGE